MIILDATTKTLEVILAAAITTNQLPWTVHYVDISQSDFSAQAVSSGDGVTNSATAVTMVAAPAASKSRQIKTLTVQNADTAPATVTVRINDNGTYRPLITVTLSVGDNLVYGD